MNPQGHGQKCQGNDCQGNNFYSADNHSPDDGFGFTTSIGVLICARFSFPMNRNAEHLLGTNQRVFQRAERVLGDPISRFMGAMRESFNGGGPPPFIHFDIL